ncbi:hypothetical protein H257_09395 [Aphanomyces astaci]|uniref:C2H2-type domain-containing protein n=1 Tax=Aphanomyces astaci TaxID=112090 RepID=W4G9H1_APHAT|nr:hypothetical protein H257_09395 [Aphanomyces astaci]ETV76357.1 hypothetical protein H257_09395 [Aphanomyces astaci]RHY20218.1 hypothetical protein DYB36_000181 [Aphanomyces astaci]RHY89464.1 hypothetical protein DYB35_009217 [Aphanomyces astaci]RHZ12072.1 hypothetical protein DYB37_009643 [Aphanomyces astaci]RQM21110.1 hypothetical protein B5M09_010840 [Aphanomyces astaci]|eukprot:XP_009833902.1 hypothetical protein H257_09395 [Aphanomyces astaci]
MGGGTADSLDIDSETEKPPKGCHSPVTSDHDDCNSCEDGVPCNNGSFNDKPRQEFVCPVEGCHRVFCSSSNLGRHVKAHSGLKPYACEKCSKRFGRAFTLARHQITHTGAKPYHCEICHKGFNTSGNLCRHRHIHEKEKVVDALPGACDKKRKIPMKDEDGHVAKKLEASPLPSPTNHSRAAAASFAPIADVPPTNMKLEPALSVESTMVDDLVNKLYLAVGDEGDDCLDPIQVSGDHDTDTESLISDVFSDFELDLDASAPPSTLNPAQVVYSTCMQMENALKHGSVTELPLLAQQATQAAEMEMQDVCQKYEDAGRRFGAMCQVAAPTVTSAMCRRLVFLESEKNCASRLVERSRRLVEQTCHLCGVEDVETARSIMLEVVCASQDAAGCMINASEANLSELMLHQAAAQEASYMMVGRAMPM